MNETASSRPWELGALACGLLLGAFFAAVSLVSGWRFALSQLSEFWYYIVPLAAGFGVQVALFVKLRELLRPGRGAGSLVAASGTTSTAAMISCCAHYLANVAPVLGATGLVTFAAQYQLEFFWVGLAFNAAGIAYVGGKLAGALKEHARCAIA